MKKRWNANTWTLAVLGGILLLVGIDVGRRMVAGPVPPEAAKPSSVAPDFKVGDLAPDFTLPDAKGKQQKLSELVKRDTLLSFSCGCNQCREFQTWTGRIMPMLGKDAPDVITVNTTQPDAADSWRRDTKLKQTMLFGSHTEGPVAAYHGSPCPRSFRLDGDRKVQWIGGSRAEGRMVMDLSMDLAQEFKVAERGKLPRMEWQSDGPTASPFARPAGDAGPKLDSSGLPQGQGPNDGHNHGPNDGHNH